MTSDRIKANRAKEVKPASRSGSPFQRAALVLLGFGFSFAAYAADTSPTDLPPPVAEPAYSGGASLDLNSSDTKRYQVEILKRAGTSAIFLFGNSSHSQPKVGKILLLKKDAEPVMAVRVLRSDTTKKRFAARAIKFYGTHSTTMKSGEALTVFERSDGAPLPVAPPSVTPDTLPIELEPEPIAPPPVEPQPEPAPPVDPIPPPLPEPAPAPLPTPVAPTPKAPTAPDVPTKIPAKVTPPPVPKPTETPAPQPTSTPTKKPAAPTIPTPPPVRPPVPEIPRPDAGAGPGMLDLSAPPPPVPDPSTPETTIPSTDGGAPPTAPSSKAAPATDTVTSALSAPTQAPAAESPPPSTDSMLQELEVQTAGKGDTPPADTPPPDAPPAEVSSQEIAVDSPPSDAPPPDPDAPPPPDPEAPPDPGNVTELDTSALDSQAQENPQTAENEPPPDVESDAPPPSDEPPPEINPVEEQDDSTIGMAIEEVSPIDTNSQGLTFSFGAFRNNGPPDNPNAVYFFGGGMRYALMLGHMIFAQGTHVQDSFAIEPGIFYYKLVNFIGEEAGDSFTLVPLIGTLRYTLMFGESFSFFLYGGLMFNYLAQASGPEGQTFDDAKFNLQSTLPAVGAGMIFRVGPNWDVRVDLGTDVAQAGLMLRF